MTTFDYLVTSQWPLIDHLVTTWWLFGDHLVTIWWPLYQLFFSSSSVLHSVTTWWLLSTFVQFLFFAPVSTAHPPAFGAYWYFRQFCHDRYFFEGFERYVHNKKQISRDIYDITIWWYHHNYYHNYPCNHHYNHRNFLRSSAQNILFYAQKKRTKLHWGEGGVSDKKKAKCDIHRYAPFLRQVNKSTYFGMKINFEEFFSRECHCLLLEVFLLFQRLFCHFCHENSNSPGGKVQECS